MITRLPASIQILVLGLFLLPGTSIGQSSYVPAKVVYDVSSAKASDINMILDRANLLQKVYEHDSFNAAIVIMVHDAAIPFFSNTSQNKTNLQQRARNLSLGEVIQFRICAASARMQGFSRKDFPSYIQMVRMADADIIQLQNQGYAYLH